VGERHVAELRMRKPQRQIGEREVGDHLPVTDQKVQPLGIPRAKISMLPDRVRKDCHSTSICDAGDSCPLASDD
jgi:hypothetical protein